MPFGVMKNPIGSPKTIEYGHHRVKIEPEEDCSQKPLGVAAWDRKNPVIKQGEYTWGVPGHDPPGEGGGGGGGGEAPGAVRWRGGGGNNAKKKMCPGPLPGAFQEWGRGHDRGTLGKKGSHRNPREVPFTRFLLRGNRFPREKKTRFPVGLESQAQKPLERETVVKEGCVIRSGKKGNPKSFLWDDADLNRWGAEKCLRTKLKIALSQNRRKYKSSGKRNDNHGKGKI